MKSLEVIVMTEKINVKEFTESLKDLSKKPTGSSGGVSQELSLKLLDSLEELSQVMKAQETL
jgi:hypothetical protein